VTKGTRDEGYYWSAFHKERKMRKILYDMKEKNLGDKKGTLMEWVK
jgi:ERCC4-related helicase